MNQREELESKLSSSQRGKLTRLHLKTMVAVRDAMNKEVSVEITRLFPSFSFTTFAAERVIEAYEEARNNVLYVYCPHCGTGPQVAEVHPTVEVPSGWIVPEGTKFLMGGLRCEKCDCQSAIEVPDN